MVLLLENQKIPESGPLEINLKISVEIKVSAEEAKRRVSSQLVDRVSLLLGTELPTLVVSDRILWRVPVVLSLPSFGRVGQVGTVEVDCETGELLLTPAREELIKQTALALAQKFPETFQVKPVPAEFKIVPA